MKKKNERDEKVMDLFFIEHALHKNVIQN